MEVLAGRVQQAGGSALIIGDKKSPPGYELEGTSFFSLTQQNALDFELGRILPIGHYCRKNLGYLLAMAQGALPIYETDDDNAPLPGWTLRERTVAAQPGVGGLWLNAYRHFSTESIWPRGFPLDEISNSIVGAEMEPLTRKEFDSPIQQGLANGSPDVDAVWRLVQDRPIEFRNNLSLHIPLGSWCPFNSQSTWWWPEAYPLMYLPSYCSFRMTDIWRSFIAQRCLWELGYGVVFHASEVFQERNEHDLMRDFADEVDGYLRNKEMVRILADLKLKPGPGHQGENLLHCYEALTTQQFFPEKELKLVGAWLADIAAM
jgi:hypothetical protein